MVLKQTADLRASSPLSFGSEESAQTYSERVAALRAHVAATTPKKAGESKFIVGPGQRVRTCFGATIYEGAEVSAGDVADEIDSDGVLIERGALRFHALLARGVVIEVL